MIDSGAIFLDILFGQNFTCSHLIPAVSPGLAEIVLWLLDFYIGRFGQLSFARINSLAKLTLLVIAYVAI